MIQITDTKKNREHIVSLWQECFGDKRDYIEFFLNECPHICISKTESGVPVSMLFLLDGMIENRKTAYIYAACTSVSFRGRGYMAELIEYIRKYCVCKKYDALFLVPAEESLYDYYRKFGFIDAFRRYGFSVNSEADILSESKEITDADEAASIRNRLLNRIPSFCFDSDTSVYSIKEHFRCGGKVYVKRDSDSETLIFTFIDNGKIVIKELLSDKSVEMLKKFEHFTNNIKENIYIQCPIVYNNTDNMEKSAKCGMYYPLTDEMKVSSVNKTFYAGLYLD